LALLTFLQAKAYGKPYRLLPFVVPRGTEHRPSSQGGSILMFEPTGRK